MVICGIKLTHDGAVALIDNGKLIFSYEMEKLDNMPRHSDFSITLEKVEDILSSHGYSLKEIDRLVLDGWDFYTINAHLSAEQREKLSFKITIDAENSMVIDKIAEYGHFVGETENILKQENFEVTAYSLAYNSYKHVSSHVFAAYCTSPFAKRGEDSYILVWDGGMPPQLFYYRYNENTVENLGPLFPFMGYMYIIFSQEFEPFNLLKKGDLSVAGKVMAYVALGKLDTMVMDKFREIYTELIEDVEYLTMNIDRVMKITADFIRQSKEFCDSKKILHANMLATFQVFLQELLIENLEQKVRETPDLMKNLCFSGGSALNIKWNSGIRKSSIFNETWVPPFPNDAGCAIGAACCEMIVSDNLKALEWSVYSGPPVMESNLTESEYLSKDCTLEELANILFKYNEPVVFINGSAEMGPRSLGNRSLLSPAVSPDMKKMLNKMKGREDYRPVAPICMEENAMEVFDPGVPDPYMLYEHIVRIGWKDKVPAICHLDGTARLQTVNKDQNPVIYELLSHYKKLSGIPLLCNTSANFNGKGFFPDIKSVMEWGKADFIWNNGRIYFKKDSAYSKILSKTNQCCVTNTDNE
ncbi:carbamoyltransferase N-terminal domain-containing protein [Olivibacter jilunii]|uniref:carbamoyltransferase N-terminal domain-containing protein n=1 Tax=Olivibacter jilunii TaxID=985016 RepID=UPI0010305F29|nr:carbamoyltransferase N-terminal domain-containing protein [Olivibacter jilunii]